jgi:hypothetical protein
LAIAIRHSLAALKGAFVVVSSELVEEVVAVFVWSAVGVFANSVLAAADKKSLWNGRSSVDRKGRRETKRREEKQQGGNELERLSACLGAMSV